MVLPRFFKENEEYEQEFEKVDHLPWQLLPFWVDSVPNNLSDTAFSQSILEIGAPAVFYRQAQENAFIQRAYTKPVRR